MSVEATDQLDGDVVDAIVVQEWKCVRAFNGNFFAHCKVIFQRIEIDLG